MTAPIEIREGSKADRDAILALRRLAFPDDDVEKQSAQFWEWEFGKGRVFVAGSAGTIVGHGGFVRQEFVSGETLKSALFVDAMTHPDYRRQKLFSRVASFAAGHLQDDVDLITAFQIRKPVLGAMLSSGWRPVAKIPVLLKPISLLNLLRLPVARSPVVSASTMRPLQDGDLPQIDALLQTQAVRQPRTAEFIRWRYLSNPAWRYDIDGAFDGDRLRSFIIHRVTTLRGIPTVALVDFGGDPTSFQPLLRHVFDQAKSGGIGLAAALVSRDHPAYGLLRRGGFFPGPHRFRLLLQVFRDRLTRLYDDEPWSISWGDTDHV